MKRILLIAALLFLTVPAYANVPISGLPAVTAVGGADIGAIVQAGTTSNATMDLISEVLLNDRNTICSLSGMPAICDAFFGYADPRWYGAFCAGNWNINTNVQDDGPGIAAALATGYTVMLPYPGCKIATTVKYTGNNQNMSSFSTIMQYNQNNSLQPAANGNIFVPNNLSASAENCAIDFNGYAELGLANLNMHANNEGNGSAAMCDSFSNGSSNAPRNGTDDFVNINNMQVSNFGMMLGGPTDSSGNPLTQPCSGGSCMGGSFIQMRMSNWFSDHNFWALRFNMSDSHFDNFWIDNAGVAISNYPNAIFPSVPTRGDGSGMFSNGRVEFSGNNTLADGVVVANGGSGAAGTFEMTQIEFDHNNTACLNVGPNAAITLNGGWMNNCALGAAAGKDAALLLENGANRLTVGGMDHFADFNGHPLYGLVALGTSTNVQITNSPAAGFGVTGNYNLSSLPTNFRFQLLGAPQLQSDKMGLGIGTTVPLSQVDVGASGIAVGTGYAGVTASPSNGAIIQGSVGLGTNTPATPLDVNGDITMETGTAGAVLCLTAAKALGHCTAAAACTGTCTCTCAAN